MLLQIDAEPITLWREDSDQPYHFERYVPDGVLVSLEGYAPIDNERAMAHLVTIRQEHADDRNTHAR